MTDIREVAIILASLTIVEFLSRSDEGFLAWRDMMPSKRQADYAWTVLMLLIAWGREVGLTSYRPPVRIDKL